MLFNFLSSLSLCFITAISFLFITPTFATNPTVKKPITKNTPIKAKVPPKEFSVKGIKFGMTKQQISTILGQEATDTTNSLDLDLYLFSNFTIGGVSGFSLIETESRVYGLSAMPRPEVVDNALITFSKQYGKPIIRYYVSSNALGAKVDNYTAIWDVGTATITMEKYIDFSKGWIEIKDKAYAARKAKYYENQEKQKQKDF
jgi:hypothetical protein